MLRFADWRAYPLAFVQAARHRLTYRHRRVAVTLILRGSWLAWRHCSVEFQNRACPCTDLLRI
jgi:hypothetical protein